MNEIQRNDLGGESLQERIILSNENYREVFSYLKKRDYNENELKTMYAFLVNNKGRNEEGSPVFLSNFFQCFHSILVNEEFEVDKSFIVEARNYDASLDMYTFLSKKFLVVGHIKSVKETEERVSKKGLFSPFLAEFTKKVKSVLKK